MNEKPKYKAYKPDQTAPLFMRFANDLVGPEEIVQGLVDSTEDEKTKEIALNVNISELDLGLFKEDFRSMLDDIISGGVFHPIANYLNAYMEPSLLEHGAQKRWVTIRSEEAPWIEALLCYNLTLFIKAFGKEKLQRCPTCHKYFQLKKFKYKFCSEKCKIRGDGE